MTFLGTEDENADDSDDSAFHPKPLHILFRCIFRKMHHGHPMPALSAHCFAFTIRMSWPGLVKALSELRGWCIHTLKRGSTGARAYAPGTS